MSGSEIPSMNPMVGSNCDHGRSGALVRIEPSSSPTHGRHHWVTSTATPAGDGADGDGRADDLVASEQARGTEHDDGGDQQDRRDPKRQVGQR